MWVGWCAHTQNSFSDSLLRYPIRSIVLYLSDFDPEGEYFPELFREQLPDRYGCDAEVTVEKLALTRNQIEAWKPPWIDFTVKQAHKRKEYVAKFLDKIKDRPGPQKVELDAVDNITLRDLIHSRLTELLNVEVVKRSGNRSKRAVAKWRREHRLS